MRFVESENLKVQLEKVKFQTYKFRKSLNITLIYTLFFNL